MSEKGFVEQFAEEVLGAPTPEPVDEPASLQKQRDILEAGIRLALSALANGDADTARSHLEEALQRSLTQPAQTASDLGTLP
ncbi:MAG: hypothetical protein K2X62_12800 [Beijerinckiaceae bacterium]|jgi:Tfp pilus assembly protein PilF|nr:hypothetical protein [Beijerinckiaceae bacterium]MDO9442081.1 hypothetical protein [Beijerinckiaceae bacterium]